MVGFGGSVVVSSGLVSLNEAPIRKFDWSIFCQEVTPFYAPNFEEVEGAYWFRVVHPCIHL